LIQRWACLIDCENPKMNEFYFVGKFDVLRESLDD